MKNYPSHTLYAVTQGDEQAKADWLPIGVAFTNRDASLSISFDEGKTQPAGSRLILRTRKPRAARSDTSNQGGQQ